MGELKINLNNKEYILIKGIGSIGQRHVNNLLALGYHNLILISKKEQTKKKFNKLIHYQNIDEALCSYPISHAIICSPTANHINDIHKILNHGINNIYLEKPVSHTMSNVNEIELLININKANVYVGFDLHYDQGLHKVKNWISERQIGKVLSANAFVGQDLKQWRPNEDYKKGMSASISQGGGVLLDLIHEFDYLRWILGEPELITALVQHNKILEIETEDLADVLIQFKSNINATIHLDYHQRKLIRNCIITGELGTIIWNLSERKSTLINNDGQETYFDYSTFERNDRYLEIIRDFITHSGDVRLTTYSEALISLKMVLAAKKAAKTNSFIRPSEII
jgi:predicted dehydrogenase